MSKSIGLRVLCATLFLVMIGWAPASVFAQRGGHGGGGGHYGGGWHGGGSSGWRGGGGSGWRGGGGSGWRGGGGWRGGWGSPGFRWGFSIGLNFGPSWGGFASPFFFGPVWAPPFVYLYPVPFFVPAFVPATPAGFADSSSPNNDGYAYASGQSSSYVPYNSSAQQYTAPAQRPNTPAPSHPPAANSVTLRNASYTSPAPQYARAVTATSSNFRPTSSIARQLPPLRPEVQNVIRALRAMPTAARLRQIDSGRYSNLTPQELQIVRYAANVPSA